MEITQRITEVKDLELFDQMEKGSYYTIIGAGGEVKDWIEGYTKMLKEQDIGTPREFYTFKGEQMNSKYNLSKGVAYKKDLTFISFPLDNLNISRLAMFKIRNQDRWFDDIVSNNKLHMRGW